MRFRIYTSLFFVYALMMIVGVSLVNAQTGITIDYPESTSSIASLLSVDVVGESDMTYCSLLTKTNLQRFTGLPTSRLFGQGGHILEGDAIRIIDQGLRAHALVGVDDPVRDIPALIPLSEYSLFDFYIYTPHAETTLTEEDYLLQGHRVVLLYADEARWVMDPIKGKGYGWQTRQSYQSLVDPSALFFIVPEKYEFTPGYVMDLHAGYRRVDNISFAGYAGLLDTLYDDQNMPIAYLATTNIVRYESGISFLLSSGTLLTRLGHQPFSLSSIEIGKKQLRTSLPVISTFTTLSYSSLFQLFPLPFASPLLPCGEKPEEGREKDFLLNGIQIPLCVL